jgi:hypothetical protein
MRSIALLVGTAVLAGCASQNLIKKGTDQLVGQPIDVAVAKLGMPTEERTIADTKVYVWTTDGEGTQSKCTIRAITRGDVIGSFDWEGDESQCSHYALMLRAQPSDCRKGILDARMWLLPCSDHRPLGDVMVAR